MSICFKGRIVALGILLLATGGCKSARPRPASSESSISSAPNKPVLQSHCDVLKSELKKAFEDNSLECLPYPGFIEVAIHGSAKYPNESTLAFGFGGVIPEGVIGNERPGGTLSHAYAAQKSTKAGANLKLKDFFSYLPDLEFSAVDDAIVSVSIQLVDLQIHPIHNVPEAIAAKLRHPDTKERQESVDRMRQKLCEPGHVIATLALSAKPLITITTSHKESLIASAGWNSLGFKIEASRASIGEVTLSSDLRPLVLAAQLRNSADWLGSVCQLELPPPSPIAKARLPKPPSPHGKDTINPDRKQEGASTTFWIQCDKKCWISVDDKIPVHGSKYDFLQELEIGKVETTSGDHYIDATVCIFNDCAPNHRRTYRLIATAKQDAAQTIVQLRLSDILNDEILACERVLCADKSKAVDKCLKYAYMSRAEAMLSASDIKVDCPHGVDEAGIRKIQEEARTCFEVDAPRVCEENLDFKPFGSVKKSIVEIRCDKDKESCEKIRSKN